MKLISAHVTNYRSIENSGEFDIDNVLCLVGKNEAGKSALLYALAGLNPHPLTLVTYDVEKDYPRRHLNQYEERHKDKQAEVIKTKWKLSDEEVKKIEEWFGKECLNSPVVKILRRYNSKDIEWDVSINLEKSILHLIRVHGLNTEELKPIKGLKNSQDLISALKGIEDPTENQKALLKYINELPSATITGKVLSIIKPSLPHFMYFSHYDRMDGQIRIDTFDQRNRNSQTITEGERVFIDFLEFAGTSASEIISSTTYERLNAKCEAASNSITEQLLEYWTQNPSLEIEVRVTKAEPGDEPPFNSGIIARARVKNNLHKVTVPFSERSAGFIWFFSFLVKFSQVRKDDKPLILLLDEPGLTLHGKAQADLLRYFDDKLSPNHQVIFSTHSPFMVPTNNFPGIKIVEDKISQPKPGNYVTEGTKVRGDALATDRDTLFPLQGALGYELTQSLFIGKNTLLLEGPGDILYLQAWSNALKKANRIFLDPKWIMCPAGGIDKIQPFVSLFSGAKLDVVALTDFSKKDSRKLESLIQNKIMESEKLLNFASLLNVEEADIEDVIHPELFVQILNKAFALTGENQASVKKLDEALPTTSRLVKKSEAFFNMMPPSLPLFDHFTPAMWLLQNPSFLEIKTGTKAKGLNETLDSAEIIIKKLNLLIAN